MRSIVHAALPDHNEFDVRVRHCRCSSFSRAVFIALERLADLVAKRRQAAMGITCAPQLQKRGTLTEAGVSDVVNNSKHHVFLQGLKLGRRRHRRKNRYWSGASATEGEASTRSTDPTASCSSAWVRNGHYSRRTAIRRTVTQHKNLRRMAIRRTDVRHHEAFQEQCASQWPACCFASDFVLILSGPKRRQKKPTNP